MLLRRLQALLAVPNGVFGPVGRPEAFRLAHLEAEELLAQFQVGFAHAEAERGGSHAAGVGRCRYAGDDYGHGGTAEARRWGVGIVVL